MAESAWLFSVLSRYIHMYENFTETATKIINNYFLTIVFVLNTFLRVTSSKVVRTQRKIEG